MRLNKLYKALVLGLAVFSANTYAIKTQDHASLSELQSLEYSEDKKVSLIEGQVSSENIRLREVRNAALALGAQHGYIEHMNYLKEQITSHAISLDRNFDFNTLMKLSGGHLEELYFVPPVISEVENAIIASEDARRITVVGKDYNIDRHGRLVTSAPNWRQYLLFDQPVEVSKPVSNLLPKNKEEKIQWQEWVKEGWLAGFKQADREMLYRERRLGSDFSGMVRYVRLVTEGKINKPMIVSATHDVRGGGAQMRINEQVIELAVPTTFDTNADNWEALILDSRGSLRYPDEERLNDLKDSERKQ